MPALQVVNFGDDPYANAMGGFAENFLDTLNEKTEEKRNDKIFKEIKEKYKDDADPENFFKDIMESEGLSKEYKSNKMDQVKAYADLSFKANKNRMDQIKVSQLQDDLGIKKTTALTNQAKTTNETNKIANTTAKLKRELPNEINKYTDKLFKDSGKTLKVTEKAEINNFMQQLMEDEENPMGMHEAFTKAYALHEAQQDLIKNFKITPKPTKWGGAAYESGDELKAAKDKAYQELQKLHDEDGITSQTELRKIAANGSWSAEDITEMLQRVFQSNGKKLKGPKPQTTPTPTIATDDLAAQTDKLMWE